MTEYFMPISELSKKLDIPAHTLRFWEKEFPTLIVPVTGAGGRRFYRQETVDKIFLLKKHLYADGYTIDGVKKLIKDDTFDTASELQATTRQREEIEFQTSEDIDMAIDLLESAISDLSIK